MKLLAFILLFFITGCVATYDDIKSTRYNTEVTFSAFNSISSKYTKRPTFATASTWKDDKKNTKSSLYYNAESFGSSYSETFKKYQKDVMRLTISDDNATEILEVIEKFLIWEKKATDNGDMFTKIIKKVNSEGSNFYNSTFYSANSSQHYLIFKVCFTSLGAEHCLPSGNNPTLDLFSAKALRKDIKLFLSNEIQVRDIQSEYN